MSEIMVHNPTVPVTRTPELIAAEINSIKDQTQRMVIYNSIEIGRRLVEAKSLLKHGEWGAWLQDKVDYSQRTANNLMKIFEEYGAKQLTLLSENNLNSQAFANLTYTQAVALLGIPDEERESFVKENDVNEMSTRELQQAIKKSDEARKLAEELKKAVKEKTSDALKFLEEKNQIEAEKRLADSVLRETQEDVKRLQEALISEREESKAKIKKYEETMVELGKRISDAEGAGDAEEVERLMGELERAKNSYSEAEEKIKDLEKQLKEKSLEVAVSEVVEKVPEEIQKELEELRQKSNPVITKFKVQFDDLVKRFGDLLGTIKEFEDIEQQEKYKKAVRGLIGKMQERL